MSEQMGQSPIPLQNALDNEPSAWSTYWQTLRYPERSEPEISIERQKYLAHCRTIQPNIEQGIYPFKGIGLSRADIEWLLATHDQDRGPIDWSDEQQRERKGLDLRGADLSGVDLRGLPLAHLRGGLDWNEWLFATVEQRCMAGVRLEGANLNGAHLEGASLSNANLEKVTLIEANLEKASLIEANLEKASLSWVHLEGAVLSRANLNEVILTNAHLDEADFSGANLKRTNLTGAHLERANLQEVNLQDASLAEADLEMANLSKAHLERAELSGAHLEKADLSEAHLEKAELRRVLLVGANLQGAHLEGAFLKYANLEKADLRWAFLKNAYFRLTRLKGANLSKSNLMGAILNAADLEEANLSGAHLEGTDLSEAHLAGTNLSEAFFDDTTRLDNIVISSNKLSFIYLVDVHWRNVNLAVVDWSSLKMLGEDHDARQEKTYSGLLKSKDEVLQEYQQAIRANRQLALALQNQGLNEVAAYFMYRAKTLHRKMLWQQILHQQISMGQRLEKLTSYAILLFLEQLTGYGYRPMRILLAYLVSIIGFATAFYIIGRTAGPSLSPNGALILSIVSFHGKGFFPGGIPLDDPITSLAAIEAVLGLLIEISFIVTLVQRAVGK